MTARRASAPASNRAAESYAPPKAAALPIYRALPVSELVPFAGNPRLHSPDQVAKIAASITEFGFTNPILIDGHKGIIAGHGRLLAAQKLGLAVVPTIALRGLSDAQKRALIIADNKLALGSTWDTDLLAGMLGDLKLEGFEISLTGFDALELDGLLGPAAGNTDPDDAPPVQAEAVSRLGDVWTLGRHTLHCADCRDVLPTLAGIDAVVTDPPYGIGFKYAGHDDSDYGEAGYGAWLWQTLEQAENIVPAGALMFVWQASPNIRHFAQWFPRDWRLFCAAKNFVQMRPIAMQYAYDPVIVWWKEGGKPWAAPNTDGTIKRDWHIADTASVMSKSEPLERAHPCPRPADQVTHIIEQWCKPGSTVLDLFAGSGTTLIAAERTRRACVGIEVHPQYCDVAVRRWEQFTGAVATLADDGRTFSAIATERTRRAA
jgi:DNA modification methylase